MTASTAIAQAIETIGAARAAAACGVTVQAACFYRDGKRRLPAECCPLLEQLSNGRFPCEQLRPDIHWVRLPDPDWPWHPAGRPLRDDTRPVSAPASAETMA